MSKRFVVVKAFDASPEMSEASAIKAARRIAYIAPNYEFYVAELKKKIIATASEPKITVSERDVE